MKALLSVLMIFTFAACASKKDEEKIQAKAAKESSVSGQSLGNTIHDLIESSKTLTATQKKELTDIIGTNKKRADMLMEDSYKLRAVLIKSLLSGKENKKEVALLKKDIEKIEALRLQNTFDTVEKITNIVSNHPEKHEYVDHLILMERAGTH